MDGKTVQTFIPSCNELVLPVAEASNPQAPLH
jgi:hypothetical protein